MIVYLYVLGSCFPPSFFLTLTLSPISSLPSGAPQWSLCGGESDRCGGGVSGALLLLGDGPSCSDQVSSDPSDQRPHMGCFSHRCQSRCAAGGVDIVLTVYNINWSYIILLTGPTQIWQLKQLQVVICIYSSSAKAGMASAWIYLGVVWYTHTTTWCVSQYGMLVYTCIVQYSMCMQSLYTMYGYFVWVCVHLYWV